MKMILKNNIFILLSIFHIIITTLKNESLILFPFKIIELPYIKVSETEEGNEIYNYLKFFNDHYSFRMFTQIQIGTPPQNIISFINFNYNNLLLGELAQVPYNIYPDSFYDGYKYNKSSSFINITSQNINKNFNSKSLVCEEKLYLFSNIKNIEQNKCTSSNFKFAMEKKIKENNNLSYGLIIGLKLDDIYYETNFLKQIKNKNLISSYIISFEFTKENEGLLVIGKYPHEYIPEKYKEENYKSFYSVQPTETYLTNFVINFDEIYSFINNDKIEIQNIVKGHIFPNMGLIEGVKQYQIFIEKEFFNKYIDINICQKNMINYDWDEFIIFSCEDNENFNLEEFPSLNFKINSENLNFELTYKDLFKKIDNKYYFLIIFKNFDVGSWCIGKPFYLKYTLVYNGDSKTIGFYNKMNNEKIKNNKKILFELEITKIVVIIIFFLVFILIVIIISYYFGKKLNLIRKKHANELEDNYDYYSNLDKNQISKKDINEKNIHESNELHLELSTKSN